jgi:hypothetical protein
MMFSPCLAMQRCVRGLSCGSSVIVLKACASDSRHNVCAVVWQECHATCTTALKGARACRQDVIETFSCSVSCFIQKFDPAFCAACVAALQHL